MAKVTNGDKRATSRERRLAERRRRQQQTNAPGPGRRQQQTNAPGTSRRRSPSWSSASGSMTPPEEVSLSRSVFQDLYGDLDAASSVSRGRAREREEVSRSRSPGRRRVRPRATQSPRVRDDVEEDEEDLRWRLSRNRMRERHQERRLERRVVQDDGLRKELRRLQKDLEDMRDGTNDVKRAEWKNKSNEHQYQHNMGTLKTLKMVKEYIETAGEGMDEDELRERVNREIQRV